MEAEDRLATKKIPIVRMECPTCIPLLEREVQRLEGVEEARGSYVTKTLRVTYNPARVDLREIEAAIERLGYRIAYKRYPGVASRIRGLLGREKPSGIRSLSDDEFPDRVLKAPRPVAVLFATPTCPTCRGLKLAYEEAAEGLEGEADLYEMDIASTETWRRYDILAIPIILVFRGGEVAERLGPFPRREEIEGALKR
ncbi:hypothetical protein AC482_02985 [miscellaneous Crenarchaeota group-15 archaeon DG-45]|uniref:HMA domain-containing protein n=1 Tax=miscellaneous Crenarchaeota group-15 archaeon DG-45 TaxID=1685127 RepID=A0A0M0BQX2_9ARCH|nr:MAG: hypothetical protein AC482_02985 [miscellaneous Crenarchaeota group-15 archaeon DG-45]